jgi:hypothetical protein
MIEDEREHTSPFFCKVGNYQPFKFLPYSFSEMSWKAYFFLLEGFLHPIDRGDSQILKFFVDNNLLYG